MHKAPAHQLHKNNMNDLFGNNPAPSFDDPLAMLRACHGRIQAQCATLKKLLHHFPVHGCDAQARQAVTAVLRYFDSAGHHHHQDEENDLFPALLDSQNPEAEVLIRRILREHENLETAWQQLRPNLIAIAGNESPGLDRPATENFIRLYEAHVILENEQLLPLAASLLSADQSEAIGRNMAARRGVTWTT